MRPTSSLARRQVLIFTSLLITAAVAEVQQSQQPQPTSFAKLCLISDFARVSTVAYNPATDTYIILSEGRGYGENNGDDFFYHNDDDQDKDDLYDFGVDLLNNDTSSEGNSTDASSNINEPNLRRRQLEVSPSIRSLQSGIPSFLVDKSNRNNNAREEQVTDSDFDNASTYNNETLYYSYKVRECPCARGIYCHVDLDTCGIPSSAYDGGDQVGCFERSSKKTLLKNAWPLLLLWYSTILFFLVCTEKGRNARQYMALKLCRSNMNERLVDRFLTVHGFVTNRIPAEQQQPNTRSWEDVMFGRHDHVGGDPSRQALQWLPTARPVDEEEERAPTELVLKTRIYGMKHHHKHDNGNNNGISVDGDNNADDADHSDVNDDNDDDEDYDTACTICFSSLQVGDRVGKLPCDHTFHVDCLREWLPRRNVCPLCQNDRAATPRYTYTNRNASSYDSSQEDEEAVGDDIAEGGTDEETRTSNQSENSSSIIRTAAVAPVVPVHASVVELSPVEQTQGQLQQATSVLQEEIAQRPIRTSFAQRLLAASRAT